MPLRRQLLFLFPTCVASLIFAQFLLTGQESSDSFWPLTKYAGVLLLTAFVWGSVLGYGRSLARALGLAEQSCLFLPFGSAVSCLVLFAAGALHLWGHTFIYFWMGFGILGFLFWFFPSPVQRDRYLSWEEKLFLCFIGIGIILALVPQLHPDPLYYHLLSVRRWYDAGGIIAIPEHSLLFQSGPWEMLYGFALNLMSPVGAAENLIATQLASQELHFCVGWIGTVLVWREILKKEKIKFPLLNALVLVSQVFLWQATLGANNDSGLLLWASTGIYLMYLETFKARFWLASLMLGLATSNKWPSLLGSLPLLVYFIYLHRHSSRAVFGLVAGFLIALLPITLRNFHFVGAPFFPSLFLAKENPLSTYDTFLFSSFSSAWKRPQLLEILQKMGQMLLLHPINVAALSAPFVLRNKISLVTSVGASLILGLVFLHPALSWRVTGITPLLVSFLALLCLRRLPPWLSLVYLSGVFIFLNPTWPLHEPAEQIRKAAAGDAMAWLRLNSLPEQKIASLGNAELYFLNGFSVIDLDMDPSMDALLLPAQNIRDMVHILSAKNFKWALETAGPLPRGRFSGYFASLEKTQAHAALAFTGLGGRIWDLAKLDQILSQPSFKLPPYEPKGLILREQK